MVKSMSKLPWFLLAALLPCLTAATSLSSADYHPSLSSKEPYKPYLPPPKKPYHEYIHPKPVYKPKQNCTVLDDVLRAEICVPELTTSCAAESRPRKRLEERRVCFDIKRTECTQTLRTEEIEVCSYSYEHVEQKAQAKRVDVEFVKECDTQMVTVCRPHYDNYYDNPCRELAQETCFNVPKVRSDDVEVTLAFPEAKRKCEMRTVTVPEIKCEDKSDKHCQDMPTIVEEQEQSEQCKVQVAEKPKCEVIELVLPKHVCKDILYGYAQDEPHHEHHGHHDHHVEHGPHVGHATHDHVGHATHDHVGAGLPPLVPGAKAVFKPHFQ